MAGVLAPAPVPTHLGGAGGAGEASKAGGYVPISGVDDFLPSPTFRDGDVKSPALGPMSLNGGTHSGRAAGVTCAYRFSGCPTLHEIPMG